MWVTCALLTALSVAPSQAGALQLKNVRPTTGYFGLTRSDAKVLPGDFFFVAFDIDNLQADDHGRVLYAMTIELKDGTGKLQFKDGPQDREAFLTLGGNRLPAVAHAEVGTQTPPGKYSITVTVADRVRKDSKPESFTQNFEVDKPGFGIVRPQLTYVSTMLPAPPEGCVGQSFQINCVVIGFERDKTKKNPSISVDIVIRDSNKQPTTKKPFAQTFKEVEQDRNYMDLHWPVDLNRPGKFTVELKVTDDIAKKTSSIQFPITVREEPK
jgi:hypothetical protein